MATSPVRVSTDQIAPCTFILSSSSRFDTFTQLKKGEMPHNNCYNYSYSTMQLEFPEVIYLWKQFNGQ